MSKQDFTLEASPRQDVGKGASRRLRRLADQVPAIIYGAGKDPINVSVTHKDLQHALENEAFFSQIIDLKVDGKTENVILKALQRHPSKPRIMHADFQRVIADQPINVKVPLHFLNEAKCVGVRLGGGILTRLLPEIEVSCLPKDLPSAIEVDVVDLDVGQSLHISDIKLPKG